jgi:PIN domain nuclease of toxin-antitoxin system
MRILLDTHALLWAADGDPRLSATAGAIIGDGGQELLFSAVSALEIAMKQAGGRLELPDDARAWIRTRVAAFDLIELPVTVDHAIEAGALPRHHRDPWDRLLVAQARVEGVPILTADAMLSRYDVETIW